MTEGAGVSSFHYRVEIQQEAEKYSFRGLFRIVEARLRHDLYGGGMSETMVRVNFWRGPAAAVLLHDPVADTVILTRQFRYPVYAALEAEEESPEEENSGTFPSSHRAAGAWLLEIPAGIQSGEGGIEDTARREVLEEVGFQIRAPLEPIASVFPSPGASSERIRLFLGRVEAGDQVAAGGGLEQEGEDIEIVILPFRQVMECLFRGEIVDAKTIIALQHLALQRTKWSF